MCSAAPPVWQKKSGRRFRSSSASTLTLITKPQTIFSRKYFKKKHFFCLITKKYPFFVLNYKNFPDPHPPTPWTVTFQPNLKGQYQLLPKSLFWGAPRPWETLFINIFVFVCGHLSFNRLETKNWWSVFIKSVQNVAFVLQRCGLSGMYIITNETVNTRGIQALWFLKAKRTRIVYIIYIRSNCSIYLLLSLSNWRSPAVKRGCRRWGDYE